MTAGQDVPLTISYTPEDSLKAQAFAFTANESKKVVLSVDAETSNVIDYSYLVLDTNYHLVLKGELTGTSADIDLIEGDYYLWIDSNSEITTNQEINISQKKPTINDLGVFIGEGFNLNPELTNAGEQLKYRFAVENPVALTTYVTEGSSELRFSLKGAIAGTVFESISFEDFSNKLSQIHYLKPDDYQLIVDNTSLSNNTVNAKVFIQTLEAAVTTTLKPNDIIDINSIQQGESKSYSISSTPYDQFNLDIQDSVAESFRFTVVDAFGQEKLISYDYFSEEEALHSKLSFDSNQARGPLYLIVERVNVDDIISTKADMILNKVTLGADSILATPIEINNEQTVSFSDVDFNNLQNKYQFELKEAGSIILVTFNQHPFSI